jgi:DNA-binding NarL/FixJ family response regulator
MSPKITVGKVTAVTRILIADDHYVIRKGLCAVLESRAGWKIVAEAADGCEAVEAALRETPDIAIIACTLPRMSGLEAIRRIRRQLPKMEVCLFIDGEDDSIIAAALREGARGVVRTTVPEDDLLAAVESLSRHRPHFAGVVSEALLDYYQRQIRQPSQLDLLTPREREVVQLVAEGLSNKKVSRRLELSIKTVETHRGAAMRKAGLASTADLVRYAVRNHLVQP